DGTAAVATRNPIGLSATPPRYETAPPDAPGQLTLPLPGWS
ncbi:carnitine dehydratase, partial [Amycolatopsis sp. WAC 01376]